MNILLYNHISGSGHFDSWNALFTDLLLQSGHHVYNLTPVPEVLLNRLSSNQSVQNENLHMLPWPTQSPSRFAVRMAKKLIHTQLRQNMKKLFSASSKQQAVHKQAAPTALLPVTPPPIRAWLRSGIEFVLGPIWSKERQTTLQRIRTAAGSIKAPLDYVLILYADYLSHPAVKHLSFDTIPLPWGGICFDHCNFLSKSVFRDPLLQDGMFRGFCLLDETALAPCTAAMPGRIFQHIPDIADSSLPATPPPLAVSIKKRAKDRTIVLLIGSLDDRKNIYNFCKLSQAADPDKWFFVVIGQPHLGTLPTADRQYVENLLTRPSENLMVYLKFLPEERDVNACIASTDILFAVYKNFKQSSNMFGKAAAFRKPLLVGKGSLMQRRTEKYNLGMASDPYNIEEMLNCLERLRSTPPEEKNYLSYIAENNKENLRQQLTLFINKSVLAN